MQLRAMTNLVDDMCTLTENINTIFCQVKVTRKADQI